MTKDNMVRLGLYLPQQFKDKLEKWSEKTGLSMAEIMRRALDRYFAALEAAEKQGGE